MSENLRKVSDLVDPETSEATILQWKENKDELLAEMADTWDVVSKLLRVVCSVKDL